MGSQRNARKSGMRREAGAAVVAGLCMSGLNVAGTARAQNTAPPVAPGSSLRPPDDKNPAVLVTIATDKKTYAAGEPIVMTLTVKNAAKQAVPLRFSSGQRYDFKLYEAKTAPAGKPDDSKPVWQWARGRMFIAMISSEKLEPGKTLVFSDKYQPQTLPGQVAKPLAAGKYTLVGTVTVMGAAPQPSATTTLEIK